MRPFPLKRGGSSRYPGNKTDAIAGRKSRYDVDLLPACSQCADYQQHTSEGHQRYTVNDRCVLCASMDSYDLYGVLVCKVALNDDTITVTSRSYPDDKPRKIGKEGIEMYKVAVKALFTASTLNTPIEYWPFPPVDAAQASDAGVRCFIRRDPCNVCGSPGVRTLAGGCHYCDLRKGEQSPRQKALKAGETYYTPLKPCVRCNTTAERHVFNGSCRGCACRRETPDRRETLSTVMMRESPDLIVSKVDAKSYGLKVYRTGDACGQGHEGFRYLSTGACIDCKKGV